MAHAPRPGQARAQDAANRRYRITVKGHTLELAATLTLDEKMVVRLATGIPFDQFLLNETRIGEDTVAVLWWLARRANGEPRLAWSTFTAEWETIEAGDLDVDIVDDDPVDPEASSPEGSGPGSLAPGPASPTSST